MKKRIMMLLFILGIFVVGFSSVKADIDITCTTTGCNDFSFTLVQLTSTNTASSGTYKDYASYFENYYQSTSACGYQPGYSGTTCSDLSKGFNFTGSSVSTGFDFYNSYGFHNVSNLIGSISSYSKAGTYVFLLKATNTGVTLDKSEYIINVSVKNDNTVGTTVATKIKNVNGNVTNTKVNDLAYSYVGAYPSKPESIYNVEGDFYLSNTYTAGYAEKSNQAIYKVKLPITTSVGAKIYDKSGVVSTIPFLPTDQYKDVYLKNDQVLVIPKGALAIGTKVEVIFYGMYGAGLDGNTLNVYKPSVKKSENGSTTTTTNVESGWYDTSFNSSKAIGVTIGGSGENYLEYTWTYDQNLVPSTGVELGTIIPYVIILVLSVVTVVLVLAVLKRKKTETTK